VLFDLAAAAAGVLLGLRFRAGALIAATLVAVILCLTLQVPGRGFGWASIWLAVQSAICLQLGYLAGLAVAALWRLSRGK
jgi:hypothetical protein